MLAGTQTLHASSSLRGRLFRVGILLKGLDGAIEFVGGIALFILSPGRVVDLIHRITDHEISRNHNDFVIRHLSQLAAHVSLSGERFAAAYLFAHGVIKVIVVLALLRNKLWAYPLAIAVFGGFVIYELYRFTLTHSVGLIVLSAFDLAVTFLIWSEYRSVSAGRANPQASAHPLKA